MNEMGAEADAALASYVETRPRLLGLAYRMLGSHADAEDCVQDAWVRWERMSRHEREAIERSAAWFTTTVSRLALDRLKSAQRTRETYVGPWLPEPIVTDPSTRGDTLATSSGDPSSAYELSESITLGFLRVLERLSPVERAVFLLADVFKEPYGDIALVVDRSPEACRQIAHRARARIEEERGPRRDVNKSRSDSDSGEALLASFLGACVMGDIETLKQHLTRDVVLVSDGGADRHAARRPVIGTDKVARFMMNIAKRLPEAATAEVRLINGECGVVLWLGREPYLALALEPDRVEHNRVAAIHVVVNPDKLHAIGAASPLL